MGKLIDVNKWFKDTFPKADLDYPILDNKKAYPHWSTDITGLADMLNDAESVEAILKADYEKRLKADLVAMLTEIQLEIEEYVRQFGGSYKHGYNTALLTVEQNIIQQKINTLKSDTEEDLITECKRLDGDCTRCSHKYNCCSSEYNGRH